MKVKQEYKVLSTLVSALKKKKNREEREKLLRSHSRLKGVEEDPRLRLLCARTERHHQGIIYSLVAIGQAERLFAYPGEDFPKEKVEALLSFLATLDRFYEPIGGIIGYQATILRLLLEREKPSRRTRSYTKCRGIDIRAPSQEVDEGVVEGLHALEEVGEVYPVGGLGSRLRLLSPEGDPLPVALLPFAGRSLLEGLVRDVQAREFLYYRLFHKRITIPLALMTSLEQQNRKYIRGHCEERGWFGRAEEDFLLFSQLSVPVVTEEGEWVLRAPLELHLEPGGHGALWRTAEERGVFAWFLQKGKRRLLIRQINNPLGGIDRGMLFLLGRGRKEKKAFGFISCDRLPTAAEGVLLLKEERNRLSLSNVEYTDLARLSHSRCEKGGAELGKEEEADAPHLANTNILYADLDQLRPLLKKEALPGLLLNMKKKVSSYDRAEKSLLGGRLESMMQNLSELLSVKKGEPLPCFVVRNERGRTLSAAKRSYVAGKPLLETPEGAFYDLLRANYLLLKEECHFILPPFSSSECYIEEGPSSLFLYHPALGPLYSIIAQKVRRGEMGAYAELQLEIADLLLEELELKGSLLVRAEQPLGHREGGVLCYSQKTGKCILKRIRVLNKGIDRTHTQEYWRNSTAREESLQITLLGHSEFYAEGITFSGNQTIVVPEGERWVAQQKPSGEITYLKERAGWEWDYTKTS